KNGDFELSKMAVDPKFQGNKIGETLLSYAIEFSKKQAWPKIVLYSSRQLENAIHLYRKKGFVEIPVEKEVHYERCDIKMELIF
ncbi:MAG: GNAT family N-acetyltransferase, partial [Flavobacteriaceae bacterium]|nr:GNAT family N-acetyltransferase [Flavobacteriaceae bacterium]